VPLRLWSLGAAVDFASSHRGAAYFVKRFEDIFNLYRAKNLALRQERLFSQAMPLAC
jgi:hypothetical protein